MDQPLARLAFTLLEPRSDDGVLNWNVLDECSTRRVRGSGELADSARAHADVRGRRDRRAQTTGQEVAEFAEFPSSSST